MLTSPTHSFSFPELCSISFRLESIMKNRIEHIATSLTFPELKLLLSSKENERRFQDFKFKKIFILYFLTNSHKTQLESLLFASLFVTFSSYVHLTCILISWSSERSVTHFSWYVHSMVQRIVSCFPNLLIMRTTGS